MERTPVNLACGNLFSDSPGPESREVIVPLLEAKNVRIEKIASHGESSPPGFWYDQPTDEWVALLTGAATITFEDGTTAILSAGDYLQIQRHVKHRVEKTSPDALWLAIHYS